MMPTREAAGGSHERPLTYFSLARTVSSLLSKAFSEKARWVICGSRLLDRKVGQDHVKIPGEICSRQNTQKRLPSRLGVRSTNRVKDDMVFDGLLSAHATFGLTEKI
jgi:hypothetical protein